jgi:hypothetical protein
MPRKHGLVPVRFLFLKVLVILTSTYYAAYVPWWILPRYTRLNVIDVNHMGYISVLKISLGKGQVRTWVTSKTHKIAHWYGVICMSVFFETT